MPERVIKCCSRARVCDRWSIRPMEVTKCLYKFDHWLEMTVGTPGIHLQEAFPGQIVEYVAHCRDGPSAVARAPHSPVEQSYAASGEGGSMRQLDPLRGQDLPGGWVGGLLCWGHSRSRVLCLTFIWVHGGVVESLGEALLGQGVSPSIPSQAGGIGERSRWCSALLTSGGSRCFRGDGVGVALLPSRVPSLAAPAPPR